MVPSSWGSLTGMVRRRTESMSWKMAVLAPMPRARVRTEIMAKPGLRRRRRKAWRRSCQNEAIASPWQYKTTGGLKRHVRKLAGGCYYVLHLAEANMTFRLVTYFAVAAVIAGIVFAANAQQGKWASESDPTANALIDMERRWAEESCTHSGIMETMLADDFQGTSPSGKRYTKTEAVAPEKKPKAESRECRLNDAKVRFFSENMAIIYGSESSIKKNSDGKEC